MTPDHTNAGADLLILEQDLVRASTAKRFANYLIDLIAFYILAFVVGVLLAILAPTSLELLADDSPGFNLLDRLITLVLYGLYLGIVEAAFKGKSLGKLITKTRAVNLDGSPISNQTAFARGFSKAVPFCAFSALATPCNPWQDKWTNSMVIDESIS